MHSPEGLAGCLIAMSKGVDVVGRIVLGESWTLVFSTTVEDMTPCSDRLQGNLCNTLPAWFAEHMSKSLDVAGSD